MRKITIFIISFILLSCEDNSSDNSKNYKLAKILKWCQNGSDDSIIWCDEYKWNNLNNTVEITRNDGNTSTLRYQRVYNDYGFRTEEKYFLSDGSHYRTYKWTMTDKWKITKLEYIKVNGSGSYENDYIWEGNIRKYYSDEGNIIYEEHYDDHYRLLKYIRYNSNGSINYTEDQVWDEDYQYRGLYRTNNTYKNLNNPNGYYYQATWDGDSNVYTRYNYDGTIDFISAQTVNKHDQPLIRTYSDEGGRYYTWEYGATFKSYSNDK